MPAVIGELHGKLSKCEPAAKMALVAPWAVAAVAAAAGADEVSAIVAAMSIWLAAHGGANE